VYFLILPPQLLPGSRVVRRASVTGATPGCGGPPNPASAGNNLGGSALYPGSYLKRSPDRVHIRAAHMPLLKEDNRNAFEKALRLSRPAGSPEARSGGCACGRAGSRVRARGRTCSRARRFEGAAGISFWNHDVAAICNFKCDLDKIFSRFVDSFLMRSDGTIGR
jgi:hypothetical protein